MRAEAQDTQNGCGSIPKMGACEKTQDRELGGRARWVVIASFAKPPPLPWRGGPRPKPTPKPKPQPRWNLARSPDHPGDSYRFFWRACLASMRSSSSNELWVSATHRLMMEQSIAHKAQNVSASPLEICLMSS